MFRNVTLKCLTEIAGVTVSNYDEMFIILFTRTMMTLEEVKTWIFKLPTVRFYFESLDN